MLELQGLLRQKQVLRLIPISPAAWCRGVAEGKYPKGRKLGPKTTVWLASEIQEIIDRVAAEGAAPEGQKKGGAK
jgi:predicted DNA-binding transcriptional regulator AlpA